MMLAIPKTHAFEPRSLRTANIFSRILRRLPSENALIELVNALAASTRVREVPHSFVIDLSAKYRMDLQKKFHQELCALYREFMVHCLKDRRFDQVEVDDLSHLQILFGLSDRVHNQVHEEVRKQQYQRTLREALEDSRITDEEKELLEKMGKGLKLPEDSMRRIYEAETEQFLKNKVKTALEDRMLSPDEEEEIQTLAAKLGTQVPADAATEIMLDRCRLMWRIAYGEPPSVDVPIHLQRGEVCYFTTDVQWCEMRRQTKRIRYAGPTVRLKICKGLYWRMGDVAVQRVSQDSLTPIDQGTVYVTNKRLLFTGRMKNKVIRLGKILDITRHSDGVMVEKETGRSPFLAFTGAIDIFCACLARAIQDVA